MHVRRAWRCMCWVSPCLAAGMSGVSGQWCGALVCSPLGSLGAAGAQLGPTCRPRAVTFSQARSSSRCSCRQLLAMTRSAVSSTRLYTTAGMAGAGAHQRDKRRLLRHASCMCTPGARRGHWAGRTPPRVMYGCWAPELLHAEGSAAWRPDLDCRRPLAGCCAHCWRISAGAGMAAPTWLSRRGEVWPARRW